MCTAALCAYMYCHLAFCMASLRSAKYVVVVTIRMAAGCGIPLTRCIIMTSKNVSGGVVVREQITTICGGAYFTGTIYDIMTSTHVLRTRISRGVEFPTTRFFGEKKFKQRRGLLKYHNIVFYCYKVV